MAKADKVRAHLRWHSQTASRLQRGADRREIVSRILAVWRKRLSAEFALFARLCSTSGTADCEYTAEQLAVSLSTSAKRKLSALPKDFTAFHHGMPHMSGWNWRSCFASLKPQMQGNLLMSGRKGVSFSCIARRFTRTHVVASVVSW